MSFCVNISSPVFKETTKRLNISESQLELIAHEYINAVKDAEAFPDDAYIQSKYSGTPMNNATVGQKVVWRETFATPRLFNTMDEAREYIGVVEDFLSPDSVGIKTRNDGLIEVRVAKPTGTRVLYDVYQGRHTRNSDGRPYNYYTISQREASDYGDVVEKRVVDVDGFLVKHNSDGTGWSVEYAAMMKEFKSAYGASFDILDSSEEGLKTQEAFFEFLKGKGYKGLDLLTNNPTAFLRGQEEDAYLVTFDDNNTFEENTVPKDTDDFLFFNKKTGSATNFVRQANLEVVKKHYTQIASERAAQKAALARFYYNRYSQLEFDVNDPDFGAAELRKFREVEQFILDNKDLFPSFGSFYARNGKLRISFAPITFESQLARELEMLDSWSDASLEAEAQRIQLEQEAEEADSEFEFYINPKKKGQIQESILKKNPFIGEEGLEEAFWFLEELENTPDNNQFVDCCIRWIKNGTISLPRDAVKVRQLFDKAREQRLDTSKFKNPVELQIALVKETKTTDGELINPDKYSTLRFNHNETVDGHLVQIYDVEDSEYGRQTVCQILADASPKDKDGKPIVSSPWCLSTFNYDVETKKATPTHSAGMMWGVYNAGKRQIAIMDGKPVAFNSSSRPETQWWNFYDHSNSTLTAEHIMGVTEKVYEESKLSTVEFGKRIQAGLVDAWVHGKLVNEIEITGPGKMGTSRITVWQDEILFQHFGMGFQVTHNSIFPFNSFSATRGYLMDTFTLGTYQFRMIDDFDFLRKRNQNIEDADAATMRVEDVSRLWVPYPSEARRFKLTSPINIPYNAEIVKEIIEKQNEAIRILDEVWQNVWASEGVNVDISKLNPITLFQKYGETLETLAKDLKALYTKLHADSKNKALLEVRRRIEEFEAAEKERAEKENKKEDDHKENVDPIKELNALKAQLNAIETESSLREPTVSNTQPRPSTQTQGREYTTEAQEHEYSKEEAAEFGDDASEREYLASDEFQDFLEDFSKKHKGFSFRDLIRAIKFLQEKDYSKLFDEGTKKAVNEQLTKVLTDILNKYHFEIVEGDLTRAFGEDVQGAFDVLQKIVYLANKNDRSAIVDAEEFSHAFIKMMGAVWHRPENRKKYAETKVFSELLDEIQKTSFYREVEALYGNDPNYQYANGRLNRRKIQEEALGKALAATLVERAEIRTRTDKSFLAKVKQWFKDILVWVKSKITDYGKFERELNQMANSILSGTYAKKYLNKINDRGYTLQDYATTIREATEKDGGLALGIMQRVGNLGGLVTGSISYRAQGPVYRKSADSLHDIDTAWPNKTTHLFSEHPELYRRNISEEEITQIILSNSTYREFVSAYDNVELIAAYRVRSSGSPDIVVNLIMSDDASLRERFKNMTGNFNYRMSQFTEEEQSKIHLIDMFFTSRNEIKEYQDTQYGIKMSDYTESFRAKLAISRPKDLYDYQRFAPNHRTYADVDREIMLSKATKKNNGRLQIDLPDKEYVKESVKFGNKTVSGEELQEVVSRIEALQGDKSLFDTTRVPYKEWKSLNFSIYNSAAKTISGFIGVLNTEYNTQEDFRYDNKTKTQIVPKYWYEILKLLNQHKDLTDTIFKALRQFERETDIADEAGEYGLMEEFLYNPTQLLDILDSAGLIQYKYDDSRQGNLFREEEAAEAPTTITDENGFTYTRINQQFKENLFGHLRQEKSGLYRFDKNRDALVRMAEELFNFFEREGFKIVITNNPYDSSGRGSTVSHFGKYVTIYYQDHPHQGNKYLNILHELLHVATNQAISFESMGRDISDRTLAAYYNMFVAKLHEDPEYSKYAQLALNAKSYEELDKNVPVKYQILHHAESSVGEFLSCCVSNREVQEVLESIQYTDVDTESETSLFEGIKRWFRDVLERIFRGTALTTQDFLDDLTSFLMDVRFADDAYNRMDEATRKSHEAFLESRWGNAREFMSPSKQAPVVPESKPKVDQVYQNKIQRVVAEINNLLNSNIPANEVRDEANKAMDWISDQLTEYQNDPEKVWTKYYSDTHPESEKEATIKRLSTLSREELLEELSTDKESGFDRILKFYAEEVLKMNENNMEAYMDFSPEEIERYMQLIPNNLFALVQLGYSRFLEREGFGIVFSETGDTMYSTQKGKTYDETLIVDDFNNENDVDNNSEEEGNQQEHWMIESRTREILATASSLVRNTISTLYLLVDTGEKEEDGSPKYDNRRDKLGRNERVPMVTAVRSIVKWTQGARNLSDMVNILSQKAVDNPWVSQLVTKLSDRTGNESDFQSQFFTTFYRHFQPYTIVTVNENGKYYSKPVNEHPALDDAMKTLKTEYKLGRLPLFNNTGVDAKNIELFKAIVDTLDGLGKLTKGNRANAVELIGRILKAVGFPQPADAIDRILTNGIKNNVLEKATAIYDTLKGQVGNRAYDPFKYAEGSNGIAGYLRGLLQPFTTPLEDVMVSSVYDSGKMYQSFVTPSWTSKLFSKMHLDDEAFGEFLLDEFGHSEWFVRDTNFRKDLTSEQVAQMSDAELRSYEAKYLRENAAKLFRNTWLAKIAGMTYAERQEAFTHRVQLNFDKSNYMRGMNHLEYILSVYTEFFSGSSKSKSATQFAFYRFPMLSNKPSNEFVKMVRFSGAFMKDSILDGFMDVFNQELSRIQTVKMQNLKPGDSGFIANLHEGRGERFQFLDYLNKFLDNPESTVGELLDRKTSGVPERALTESEENYLKSRVREEITAYLDSKVAQTIREYEGNGIAASLKTVSGITNVNKAIEEFVWNDTFAQSQLLEILITDKALYASEEDVQKRLAQVHSPGNRGNWEAYDYGDEETGRPPQRVSDGKVRAIKLADYASFISDTLDNVIEVFDRRIAQAPEYEKAGWEALKENVIAAFSDINVVDGQAFVSPSAYRKHAFAFGEWDREAEKVYNEIKEGRYNLSSLQSVFNPRKPFTYGKVTKQVTSNPNLDTPIKTWNYGVQYKNSEYLLIMANALIAGQNTSKPNLLGALFDVLEESYRTDPKEGLDFVVFESGVKTGLSGAISLNDLVDNPEGRALAKKRLESFIYEGGVVGNAYNENYVDVLDAMDYVNQQPVPEHFMDHSTLQWGSQVRAIMPSDLETTFMGEPVVYEYKDDATGEIVRADKDKIRREWEKTTAKLVNDSVDRLREELGLDDDTLTQKERNIILSKILQREILANSRYGVDLLLACSVDENGNFRIPLGDPIQSKRIEQLISSIIKNRVNKQKVEGGTLVEVTNFGMSKKLEIRYFDKNDKNGGLLKKKSEYLAEGHTEKEYKEYLNANQGGIAYHECLAPAWTREIFQNFTDEFGNIDIEAIEMVDPELLLMFGYRIPTEDKYSTAPYKIVGFLPKEAGDGFMQPWEVTAIDGSDFDVDKKNLMRMAIKLKSQLLSKKQFAEQNSLTNEDDIVEKYKQYRRENGPSARNIAEKISKDVEYTLSAEEEAMIERDAERAFQSAEEEARKLRDSRDASALNTYNARYAEYVEPLEKRYNELDGREDLTAKDEKELERLDKQIEKKIEKLDRKYEEAQAKNEKAYNEAVEEAKARKEEDKAIGREALIKDRKIDLIREILEGGIFKNSSTVPTNQRKLFLAVKRAYLDMTISTEKKTSGRDYLNNKIFRMQWAIATHASTADKMLNPGNFNPQKRIGYTAEAYRLGLGDWDTLMNTSIKELKSMIHTQKNLMDFLTQTEFYKRNSVASQILGIFAVARSAHAMFEGRGYHIFVNGNPFTIAGMRFGDYMELDPTYDKTSVALVGKTLGSLVGASADAVKDSVLDFMNINKETVNVLTGALRLGMDFDSIALLLSSSTIGEAIETYNKTNLTKKTSFDKVVKGMMRQMLKDNKDLKALNNQELTTEEMIEGIKAGASKEIVYKTLYAYSRLSQVANTIQPTTDVSRLNSVKSAVGPQYINTLASDRKFTQDLGDVYRVTGHHYTLAETGEPMVLGDTINGITLSEDNIDMFLKAGVLRQENDYGKLTLQSIFDDMPSLGAFYEGYQIAKQYFRDMGILTATDQFQKVVDFLATDEFAKDLEFKVWNSPKLLSSLADFFQSYIIMASGTVRPAMLKYYTQDFAKAFVDGNYKNKYANNAFISAIKPTIISKEGQPDKLVLTLDTTGMEQPEKDALSSGWIQLEKEDPQLSHRLFYYNFFRGGIGFNPKTFMGLVPLQVKEKIPGYIDALRRVPEISGGSVFEQWIRNNWTNPNLVPLISGVYPSNDGKLRLKGKKSYAESFRNPYIRIKVGEEDLLFKKIKDEPAAKIATYAPITPLGNNKEYIEIMPDSNGIAKPGMQRTNRALLELEESDQMEMRIDDPNDVMEIDEEVTEELQEFLDVILEDTPGRETDIDRLTRNFNEAVKDLDIESNDSKFEEELDKFC